MNLNSMLRMKPVSLLFLMAFLFAPACALASEEKAGAEFRITLFHMSESKGDNGSSSSSGGHEYLERILAVRSDGVERVFDLPLDAKDEKRQINWQFPVRVFLRQVTAAFEFSIEESWSNVEMHGSKPPKYRQRRAGRGISRGMHFRWNVTPMQ